MALGLPFAYSIESSNDDVRSVLNGGEPAYVDYVWTGDQLVDEICAAWGITRERFIRSMAAPKPSPIAHLVFNDELRKHGYEALPEWPKGRGLLVPVWKEKRITSIRFFTLHELLNPQMKKAA